MKNELIDFYGNRIKTLRISITDKCNLRCIYCRGKNFKKLPRREILSLEEIIYLAEIFVELGIENIKITGGEPLLRKNLSYLLKKISEILGIKDLSLTTNGVLLKDMAEELRKSGIKRINISIDTLKREKFKKITGFDLLNEVFKGIEKATEIFYPVKLNVVVMRGINDDEIMDFLSFSKERGVIVRFIEFMPVDEEFSSNYFVPSYEILKKIGKVFPYDGEFGTGPSEYYITENGGVFGIISSISKPFCNKCDRIRMDCKGNVILCLFGNKKENLKSWIYEEKKLKEKIKKIVREKRGRENTFIPEMLKVGG